MTLTQIFDLIDQNVTQNGAQEITGDILNTVLKSIAQYAEHIAQGDWQNSVKTIQAAPPSTPSVGDRHLIGATTPSGAWAGRLGQIAEWDGTQWQFTLGQDNMYVRVDSNKAAYYYNGGYQANTWKWVLDIASTGVKLKAESWTAEAVPADSTTPTIVSQDTVSGEPLLGALLVFINGVNYRVDSGQLEFDCVFGDFAKQTRDPYSPSNGVQQGDYLYWMANNAGVGIQAGWKINVVYLEALNS